MAQATDAVWLPVLPDMSGFGKGIVKGADKEADTAGKSVGSRFGKAMLAGVAVVAGGAAIATKALYSIGETFDDVTDTIRVGTGATGDALNGLVDVAKNVGRNVPAEFEAIGSVVADINTRMGLTGDTLEMVASQYLEAGRILGQEVDISATSAAFNAFQIEGDAVSGALDHLFRVSQATGIGMNELAAAVQSNAPAVQALGFSFEETAALVGNLDKAGLNSSRMMMGMSQSLVRLAKDGEQPADAFRRTVSEIEGFLAAGNEAAAIDLAGEVFGTRNATQFIGAIQSGTLAMDDLASVAGMTEDTILGAGEETMDFAERWQMFKNDVLVRLEPIASRVFGFFGDAMKEITAATTAFGAAWTYNDGEITSSGLPGFMERVGYWARQAFDYIQPKFKAVGDYVKNTLVPGFRDFVGWLQKNQSWLLPIAAGILAIVAAWKTYQITMRVVQAVTRAYAAVQAALNIVMAMNPIGIVVLALVGLAAAFAVAWNRSETFRNVVTGAWDTIKGAAMAAWDWLKNAFQWMKDGIASVGQWFSDRGTQISDAWETMRLALKVAWDWVQANVFRRFMDGIAAVGLWFTEKVDQVKRTWDGIKAAFRAVWDWVKANVFDNFTAGVDRVVGWVEDGVDRVGRGWARIANIMRDPINWVIDFVWNDGLKAAFDAVARAVGSDARLPAAPTIPAFAKGGVARPGWALVGEEGPELVNFTNPGRVYTAAETQAMLGQGVPRGMFNSQNPPHGGFWDDVGATWSRTWRGARDVAVNAAGAVTDWVRGGLANAADLVLSPLFSGIGTVMRPWGPMGQVGGDAMAHAKDVLVEWIRGKDTEGPPETDRSLHGARPHVNRAAWALADAVGGIRQMQAFNQSMAGGHPKGLAVDFIDSVSKLNRLSDVITRNGGFDRFSYMAWQGRLWSPGRGWRPQGRGYGNDPMHQWHLHAEWHDQGGLLQPGVSMLANGTGKPEPVLTAGQWRDISTLAAKGATGPEYLVIVDADRQLIGRMQVEADHRISYRQKQSDRVGPLAR